VVSDGTSGRMSMSHKSIMEGFDRDTDSEDEFDESLSAVKVNKGELVIYMCIYTYIYIYVYIYI
jgi:hypothetical protein